MTLEKREKKLSEAEEICDQALLKIQEGAFTKALELFSKAEDKFDQLNDLHWLNFIRHQKFTSCLHLDDTKSETRFLDAGRR